MRAASISTEVAVDYDDREFGPTPPAGATYAEAPAEIGEEDSFLREAQAAIQRRVTDAQTLTIFRNRELKLYSRPGESHEDFAARADEVAQSEADRETAKISDRLEAKRDRLEAALETARRRADRSGRRLRYVLVGGRNVNLELVRLGAGAPYFYRGARGRHAELPLDAAEQARAERRGLWGACPAPASS